MHQSASNKLAIEFVIVLPVEHLIVHDTGVITWRMGASVLK